MLWNQSVNLTPQIPSHFEDHLEAFDTPWYMVRLGYIFNPDTSAIGTSVLYHIINKRTGVIEYQGAYLPSALMNAKHLTEAMESLEKKGTLSANDLLIN